MRIERIVLAAALVPAAAQAQYAAPQCGVARLDCTEEYGCSCDRCRSCNQPCQPEEKENAPPNNPREFAPERNEVPGAYAIPQAAGEQVGESGSIGIRGLEIRLPEIRLALPELRLPSYYHVRRGAEMHVDSARAPYVYGQAATYGMMSPGGMPVGEEAAVLRVRRRAPEEAAPAENAAPENAPPVPPQNTCPPRRQYAPPQPPCHGDSPDGCVNDYPGPWSYGENPYYAPGAVDEATPSTIPPMPNPIREDGVLPPPPAPPADAKLGEIRRMREQLAHQQRVLAELEQSMERSSRGTDAVAAPRRGRPVVDADQPNPFLDPGPSDGIEPASYFRPELSNWDSLDAATRGNR